MHKESKIYIAGHRGLVGSAIKNELDSLGYSNIIFRSHAELDLTDQKSTYNFFLNENPDYVFIAASKVGGIVANNTYPADFIRENLLIQTNVIHASYLSGVKKLLFLGSSCIYPKFTPQPIKEDYLLDGKLEPTNEAYAIAKIAGIKMCQAYNRQYGNNFISAMPTNLYGPGDNFDLETSHVIPALIRKLHEGKVTKATKVTVWGTGTPRREFLHVNDLVEACIFLMKYYNDPEIINIGYGEDITIKGLAEMIANVVGYSGQIIFDSSKPDGTPRKLLDTSRLIKLGWRPKISLNEGIEQAYKWYVSQLS